MPAFVHGKSTLIYVNGCDLSQMFNQSSFAGVCAPAETTGFGDSDKEYIAGQRDATTTISGMYAGGSAEADEILSGALGSGTAMVVSQLPYGDGAGTFGWILAGVETRYTVDANRDDAVKASLEVQSTTAEVFAQSLTASKTTYTAAGTAAGADGVASSGRGGVGALHVFSGTVSAGTAVFEHCATANGVYAALPSGTITFAGTAAGSLPGRVAFGYVNIDPTTTVNRFVRLNVAGLAGTCVLQASFGRR